MSADHSHNGHAHARQDSRHYIHAAPWQQAGSSRRAFVLGAIINITLVVVEYVVGWASHSLALTADASHNLADVTGLLLAWCAIWMAARLPSARYTYGMGGATILAALGNGLLLIIISGVLAFEAVERLATPGPVATWPVAIVAFIGMVANFATARLFHSHSHNDLNVRGVYLHMMGDAGVSLAVVLGTIIIAYTGANWIDPLLTLIIVTAITVSSWKLIRDAAELSLQGVPRSIDLEGVRAFMGLQHGVTEVHELHIWGLSTTETALTAHLVMPDGHPGDTFLEAMTTILRDRFRIDHATIQIETSAHHALHRLHAGH